MTGKEIIKALENDIVFGEKCNSIYVTCYVNVLKSALVLINRQQAEIERLRSMNQAKLDMIHDLRERLGE